MKKLLVFVFALLLSLTLFGCKPDSGTQGIDKDYIYVGNTAATSGAFAGVGVPFNLAMEVVFDKYNATHDGPDIKFIHYDDEFNGEKGLTLTKKLVEEDKVFAGTWGTGTGRPTGIATYAGIKEIAAANALSGDHIIGAFYGLGSGYRSNAYWIMSSETMSIVQGLKDNNNRYLFNDALTAGGLPTLKGRPVLEHNDLGITSILFGDISAYWIADRTGIRVRVSDEATVASNSAFEKNLVYVRVEERVDGELADTAAFVEITNAK